MKKKSKIKMFSFFLYFLVCALMDGSKPPLGPDADPLSVLRWCMADIDCEGNMHHESCKLLVENIPFNQCSDHSLIATFLEGCEGELKCAIDNVSAFCNAHSFLISLYDAIIPMEANVKVDRRAVTGVR